MLAWLYILIENVILHGELRGEYAIDNAIEYAVREKKDSQPLASKLCQECSNVGRHSFRESINRFIDHNPMN